MSDPVVEPVEAAAPAVVETAAPAAEFAPHTDTPTILQDFDKAAPEPVEAAPVDPEAPAAEKAAEPVAEAKAEEAKPTEAAPEKPAEPVAPEPIAYTDFKLPEGFAADTEKLGAFRDTIGKFGVPQEAAQSLIDLHAQTMQAYADHVSRQQHAVFADTRKGWRDQVMADPEIGGAGHRTALAAIARMRDLLVPQKERQSFDQFLAVTGAGDHPAFLKLLHRAARHFDEPGLPPPNPRPTANGGAPKTGRSVLYDNPRSTPGSRQ